MKAHEIERHQPNAQQVEIVLYLDPSLFWFRGHFAVQPLLPGVAQLDWVMHYATTQLTPGWSFHSLKNVKFQSPVLPDTTITLQLSWQEDLQILSFSYHRHEGDTRHIISSGKVRLCR